MKHLFTLIALFGLSLFAQNVPNYVPTNGLVGWWPFNGNVNDLSGKNNHGTSAIGNYSSDRFSNPNMAFEGSGLGPLPGSGMYLSNVNDFPFGNNTRSVSIWFKCDLPYPGGLRHLFAYGDNTFGTRFGVMLTGTEIGVEYMNGFVSTTFTPDNGWHHMVATYNSSGSNGILLYLDGVLKNVSVNNPITSLNTLNSFIKTIGRLNDVYNFDGSYDDIGIWNRVLTQSEIQTLYFGCTDSLSAQPVSVNASLGSTATFTAASSTSSATYQWQGKSGNTFVNLSNAGQISGSTTGILTVSGVTSANNGSEFRCIVDHGDCVDTSDVATLTACFDVTNQPFDRYVVAGTSTTFGLTTNDPSNCTYQWQTNAGFGYQNLSNAGQYSGTTSSTLAVANVSAANNNQLFRCIITAGTCKDTTNEARIILSGVGVDESTLDQLILSPNPTSGIVRFNQAIEGSYQVITSEGRVVQKGEMGEAIDLSAYPDGIYQIEVQSSNERRIFKAVKNR